MATKFTLDTLRDAVEKKFGSTDIDLGNGDIIVLRNILRMSEHERNALQDLLVDVEEDSEKEGAEAKPEASQDQALRGVLNLLVGSEHVAQRLLDRAGNDMATITFLVQEHLEGAQVGEASASQS